MIDTTNLGKIKYIYKAYAEKSSNQVHIVKYTVIYINKTYAYVSVHGSDRLMEIPIKYVTETPSFDFKSQRWDFDTNISTPYFISTPSNIKNIGVLLIGQINDYYKIKDLNDIIEKENQITENYFKIKKEYEEAARKYRELKAKYGEE